MTTDKIFAMVERIRQKTDIPMVFMTYANVYFPMEKVPKTLFAGQRKSV